MTHTNPTCALTRRVHQTCFMRLLMGNGVELGYVQEIFQL